MAVRKMNEAKYVSVRFITETDADGKHKYATRRVANIKPDAELLAVYNTAAAVIELCKYQAESVIGTEQYEILE